MKHNQPEACGSVIYSIDDLERAVDTVYPLFEKYSVITLTGSLGAGKTTLVQALLARAGVAGPIQSPTFTYVNTYDGKRNDGLELKIYHFDLYRLHALEEFFALGFNEYIYQTKSKALIEWPGIVEPLLKNNVCHITLDYEGLDMRQLMYRCPR